MKLVGKVPVEPLDDERLTNIERNLVVRASELAATRPLLRAPRRLLALAATAAVALAVIGIAWKLRAGGTAAPTASGSPEHIAMKAGTLDLGDAQIAGTDFTVIRSARRIEVALEAPGTLDLHVEHRPERLFVVKAGDVEIEDVGTRFTVAYDGTNVDVRVTEGEVKVKRAGIALAVTAGNAWTLALGPISIAELEADGTAVAQHTGVDTTADTTSDPQASTTSDPADRTDVTTTPGDGARSGSAGSGSTAGTAGSGSAGSEATKPRTPRKSNARKALERVPLEPPDDVATSDPKAAIAAYLERLKSMPEGEDKAHVLYSIAVMQHRASQDRAALYTISGVLKRQGGPAYKAARWLTVRIHCMQAFDDDCRMAAQKYLASFSDGVHAGVADEILKEISRGQ